MQCPKCEAAMEKIAYEGIEVDRCTGCKGLWFDLLEHEDLRKLSGSETIDAGSPEVGKTQNRIDRISCPVCRVPLIRMVVAGQPHISYEACSVCHGLYFDAGEFTDFREETFVETVKSLYGRRRSPP